MPSDIKDVFGTLAIGFFAVFSGIVFQWLWCGKQCRLVDCYRFHWLLPNNVIQVLLYVPILFGLGLVAQDWTDRMTDRRSSLGQAGVSCQFDPPALTERVLPAASEKVADLKLFQHLLDCPSNEKKWPGIFSIIRDWPTDALEAKDLSPRSFFRANGDSINLFRALFVKDLDHGKPVYHFTSLGENFFAAENLRRHIGDFILQSSAPERRRLLNKEVLLSVDCSDPRCPLSGGAEPPADEYGIAVNDFACCPEDFMAADVPQALKRAVLRNFAFFGYYHAKNWAYSQTNYFNEMEFLQKRIDFSRSAYFAAFYFILAAILFLALRSLTWALLILTARSEWLGAFFRKLYRHEDYRVLLCMRERPAPSVPNLVAGTDSDDPDPGTAKKPPPHAHKVAEPKFQPRDQSRNRQTIRFVFVIVIYFILTCVFRLGYSTATTEFDKRAYGYYISHRFETDWFDAGHDGGQPKAGTPEPRTKDPDSNARP